MPVFSQTEYQNNVDRDAALSGSSGTPGPTNRFVTESDPEMGGVAGPHTHVPTDILGTAVVTSVPRLSDARQPTIHVHAQSDVTGLVTDLANKANASHVHTGVYEPANANIQSHVTSPHAPSNAQKNSDITKAEIEAVLTGAISSHSHAGGSSPNWYGNLYAAYGRCDPQQLLRMATMSGTVAATPTNITASVARIAYFTPPANIIVNKIRFYGVGATTKIYRTAIYNGNTLARLTAELPFTTAATTWGAAGSGLNLTLLADTLYFIAVSVNTTGTTAGALCISATTAATTGQIGVLPKSWPGNLDIDLGFIDGAFAQFAVTTGALPATAPTIAVQSAWTGGFPLFFLDNNNA